MQYLHTMIRVLDLDAALKFFCDGLGLVAGGSDEGDVPARISFVTDGPRRLARGEDGEVVELELEGPGIRAGRGHIEVEVDLVTVVQVRQRVVLPAS